MAVQSFPAGDPKAAVQWSIGVEAEVLKKISFNQFMGKRPDSVIHVKDELTKKAGDTVKYSLRYQLDETVPPKVGNAALEGNERIPDYQTDSLVIQQIRDAVRVYDVDDRQRITFDHREEARAGLGDLLSAALDQAFFHHICGNTAQTQLGLTGNNAVSSATNVIRPPTRAADQDIVAGETFSLAVLDKAVELAKTRSPAIRQPWIPALSRYAFPVFIHSYDVTSLRNNASDWSALMDNAMQGGMVANNPKFTGHLGYYNGCVLVESTRVTQGINSSTGAAVAAVRRPVLCGAQACGMSWGRFAGNPNKFQWIEQMFDYENELGVAARMIGGLKKLIYNSIDYATIVMPVYSVASA
jgi:N4-gp56 family major capsid protein